MNIFVVLHQYDEESEVKVLDSYSSEEAADRRVKWERSLANGLIWYEKSTLIH